MIKNKEPLTQEMLELLDQVAKVNFPGGGYSFHYGYLMGFLKLIDHIPKVREEMDRNIKRLKADLKLK